MSYLQAMLMGLVEGITEFLPISSTFHLIWVAKLLAIPQTDFQKAFEVIIQGGAILAIVWLYAKEIWDNKRLAIQLLVSFVPTALIGLFLYKLIKGYFFENNLLQLAVFIGIGVLFVILDRSKSQTKNLTHLNLKHAVIIGIIQALAVIPGVSRAGAVILGMLLLGYQRKEAARYSFMLAIPTLAAAAGLDTLKVLPTLAQNMPLAGTLILGMVVAFFSALFVVSWLITYLKNHSLAGFGWYRILLGFVLFGLFRIKY